ncbi:hypothetical protein [Saccharothrix sp. ST-888]|uniref:hypothetical protein n=1 Tax=Saccharothrix sp. ST-888 TaxID=1427391 RepID=UPI0005ECAA0F|nr:hypothetical protein [Saccharothrix sp. ST-888]KJK55971.1 hypothetical protein UK12_25530 [Saccharothrix sp. ST-888]
MRTSIARIAAAAAMAGIALIGGAGVASAQQDGMHPQGSLAVGGDADFTGTGAGVALAVGGDASSSGGAALAVGGDATSS